MAFWKRKDGDLKGPIMEFWGKSMEIDSKYIDQIVWPSGQ